MLLEPRFVKISTRTGIEVRRTLPNARKRMIGAWAFADHFGPTAQDEGMVVAAHPHTGLQTATWMIEGKFEHRDSIGTIQNIEPGQLNLMTAGRGIAHSELALADASTLHAVQLWIALPDSVRKMVPEFEHQSDLPRVKLGEVSATVFAGALVGHENQRAATKLFSPLVGAEIRLPAGASAEVTLNPNFEHGFLVVQGQVSVDEQMVELHLTSYHETGKDAVRLTNLSDGETILIMLGGEPFEEPIVMWWNFIERSHDEIVEARQLWNAHDSGIPEFFDHIGSRTPAPELPNVTLRARL
ncbi:MAG: pirin family protein [Rhodoluna sp.]|nr:pirin family protein [Rhodoluna sp.]MBP7818781.1 pirin family protein [Rhodoluna sp.]